MTISDEVKGLAGAFLIGIAFACVRPTIWAFIGWPAVLVGLVLTLAALTRSMP